MSSDTLAGNVLQAKVGGLIEASTYFTYQRLFEDTYFISEPQIKFPEGATVLRANDDPSLPAYFCLLLAEGGGTQIRHVEESNVGCFFCRKKIEIIKAGIRPAIAKTINPIRSSVQSTVPKLFLKTPQKSLLIIGAGK